MIRNLRTATIFLALMTLLLGFVYPSFIWLGGQVFFARQAEGSFVSQDGQIVGSLLIGQNFSSDRYFHGRPSATEGHPYNFMASGASHLNPSNPKFLDAVRKRKDSLSPKENEKIPVDLVTASGSGLDPHISPEAALFQIPRVAKARKLSEDSLRALVAKHLEEKTFGFLGERRVNVLRLNLALDRMAAGARKS